MRLPASRLSRGFVVPLVLPLLASCAERERPGVENVDLVSLFHEAEVRSDAVDLPFLVAHPELRGPGWSGLVGTLRDPVVWTRRGEAELHLPFFSTEEKELYLRARCHESLGPRLEVTLSLNGQPVGVFPLAPDEAEFRAVLPSRVQVAGLNTLRFELPRWRDTPRQDPRRPPRGLALSGLRTRRLGGPERAALPEREGRRIRLPAASSVAYYVKLRPGARLALDARAEGQPARLSVWLDSGGGTARLAEAALSAGRSQRVTGRADAAGIARVAIANAGGGSVWLEEPNIAIALGGASPPPPAARLPGRPPIVVFLVDTLRADHLGAYGHASRTSPRFDAFAREAVLFEDAWAQAPWTRSAVASLFTGLHVGTHGLDRVDRMLAAVLPTFAESLQAAGYRTGGFSANPVVSRRFGFDQGFEAWDEDEDLRWDPASALVARALRWLDGVRGPFFLYVHALDPHSPYAPSPEHEAPFALASYGGEKDTKILLARASRGEATAEELSFLRARYQGEVRQSDFAFGELLDGLRSRGFLDRSLVLFTSDHGEEFLEHGGTEHGKTLYQEVIRIPFAVRLPGGARGGTRSADTVQQIDVMPTLLSLAGLASPEGVEGRDLSAAWVRGSGAGREPPVMFSEVRFEQADKVSARSGPLKLIVNLDPVGSWRADRVEELYDLGVDPGEKRNLAPSRPIDVRYLRNRIQGLKSLQAAHGARAAGSHVELSPEDLEQLRALGYLQ